MLAHRGEKPRFELVSQDGGDLYCLISDDAREIWRELRAHLKPRPCHGCVTRPVSIRRARCLPLQPLPSARPVHLEIR